MHLEKFVFYIPMICLVLTWVFLYFVERDLHRKIDRYEDQLLKELTRNIYELSEKYRIKDIQIKEAFSEIDIELSELINAKETLLKELRDLKRPSHKAKEDILQNFV